MSSPFEQRTFTSSSSASSSSQERSRGAGGILVEGTTDPMVSSPPASPTNTRRMSQPKPPTIDFLHDDPATMTYGRRLALYLMRRYRWYNPRLAIRQQHHHDNDDPSMGLHPSLVVAASRHRGQSAPTTPAAGGDASDKNIVQDDGEEEEEEEEEACCYPYTHSRREQPSLAKAWAYFEHVTLTRHFVDNDDDPVPIAAGTSITAAANANGAETGGNDARKKQSTTNKMQRAEPGENKLATKLYGPLTTPHHQLGDFGIGVGLYFSTLRAVTLLMILAGLLNIPNYRYFSSSLYRRGESNFDSHVSRSSTSLPPLLDGSAVCTDLSWVQCRDCDDTTHESARRAIGTLSSSSSASTMSFFLRNNCPQSHFPTAMISFATLLLMTVGFFLLNRYVNRMAMLYDEDEQTAQDYSIVIKRSATSDLPRDATDPHEWHDYFLAAFGAHVTVCTIAVDNDDWVRKLVRRREALRRLELALAPGTSLDSATLDELAAQAIAARSWFTPRWVCRHVLPPDVAELVARVRDATDEIHRAAAAELRDELGNDNSNNFRDHHHLCPATKVFCTFETEEDQQRVLQALSVGRLRRHELPQHLLFRGRHVIRCDEPEEPSAIRWQDMNGKWIDRMRQQLLTTFVTLLAIGLVAALVLSTHLISSVELAAVAIALSSMLFPHLAKFLVTLEIHASESGKQRSIYFKIALFRWVNTTVVISFLTPFTDTLAPGALTSQIFWLFLADIIASSFAQLLGVPGHLNRHVMAPRCRSQDAMNLCMTGIPLELAERYTNMTKILFLTLWCGSIYPLAYFMCAIALHVNYYVDRFSLMRTWKRPAQFGTAISEFSRRYFFPVAIVAMAVMSSYYVAGFPFDNLCRVEAVGRDDDAAVARSGEWTIRPVDDRTGDNVTIVVAEGDAVYQHCMQDFFKLSIFPFIASAQPDGAEWMDETQSVASNLFGWASVLVLAVTIGIVLYRWCIDAIDHLLGGAYQPKSRDQNMPFSSLRTISAYVPQVQCPVFSYPLLVCDVDGLDEKMFEWTDPDQPHVFYDLTKDANVLLRRHGITIPFSKIQAWAPRVADDADRSFVPI